MVLRTCGVCGRRFTKTEHFKRHERSHTREKPYQCTVCGKAFSRSDVLFRHTKAHSQKAEGENQSTPQLERRSTISEGVTDHTPQQRSAYERRQSVSNQSQAGLPVMQLLSPSNTSYLARQESAIQSHAQHSSLDMPSSYIDPRQSQQRRQHLSIPHEWEAHSPVSHLNRPTQSPKQQHQSPPQSNGAASYNNSMSDATRPAPAIQANVSANPYETSAVDWLPQSNLPGGDLQDPFQMWLFPSLGELDQSPDFLQTYGNFDTPNFGIPDAHYQDGHRTSQERKNNISKVPNERFSRVQKCWSSRPHRLHRMMPTLWKNVIAYQTDNIFAETFSELDDHKTGSNWGLDAECRFRLRDAFKTPAPTAQNSPKIKPATFEPMMNSDDASTFPPAEILDIAMGLFFRRFHPTVPFIHVPTFSVNNTPPPLLFAICLIGLSILGTTGATRFVSRMFPSFLQRVSSDLATCTSGTSTTPQQLTYLATALLTLHLSSMTGDKDTIAQTQMLYATTISLIQQNGLFSLDDGPDLPTLVSSLHETENQWLAWSRLESAKRLILCALTLDSWYSALLSRPPITRAESVTLSAPCAEPLFQAKSATQFQSLLRSGHSQTTPSFSLSLLSTATPTSPLPPLNFLGSTTLLSLLHLQAHETYHRLLPSSPTTIGSLTPHHLYASDLKARSLVPTLLSALHSCGPASSVPTHETNTLLLWHHTSLLLLADFRMFELAAGRHGAGPATPALESIAAWAATVEARRAVVHAACAYKIMHERRVSDNVTVHSVMGVFAAALVLGLWLFMAPEVTYTPQGRSAAVELLEREVDWAEIGEMGFVAPDQQQQQQQQSHSTGGYANGGTGLVDDEINSSDVLHFVRHGGTVALGGVVYQRGYESARRVLLDFANLMDGISGRKLRMYTQVLHVMSDDLMRVEGEDGAGPAGGG